MAFGLTASWALWVLGLRFKGFRIKGVGLRFETHVLGFGVGGWNSSQTVGRKFSGFKIKIQGWWQGSGLVEWLWGSSV